MQKYCYPCKEKWMIDENTINASLVGVEVTHCLSSISYLELQ